MDEKETKSLTIGDILDQLVKPTVTQGPPAQSSPTTPPTPRTLPTQTGPSEVKLPQLGKTPEQAVSSQNQAKPAELRLSIRTMTDDLQRIKRGQSISASEQTISLSPPAKSATPLPPKPLPRPVLPPPPPRPQPPPVQPTPLRPPPQAPIIPPLTQAPPSIRPVPAPVGSLTLPPLPAPVPLSDEAKHYHPEKVIDEETVLPPFLGAPIPKKVKKPTNEKIEYGLIARIVGSGMTTGISITIIMAIAAYGLIYFLYLKKPETPVVTSTPTPSSTTGPEINELKTIFSSVAILDYTFPQNQSESLSSLKTFLNNQTLLKKEFKSINITLSSDQAQTIPTLTTILSYLSLNYPVELKDQINTNYVVLIYGQEETFGGQTDSVPNKIVIIAEIKDMTKVSEIMAKWETTLPNDLKGLFDIDPTKAATQTFLTNEHRGIVIRYKNFPLPDKSIDYSILTSLTNHNYLIISNSRESMYSPTEKIQGL